MSKAYQRKSAPAIDPDTAEPDTGAAARQKIVRIDAKDASAPQTAAPRSVFDMARPPTKESKTMIDIDAVVIHTGVPIPAAKTGAQPAYAALWNRMLSGSMVELPDRQAHGLIAHVRKIGAKAAARRLRDGVKGVWRLG